MNTAGFRYPSRNRLQERVRCFHNLTQYYSDKADHSINNDEDQKLLTKQLKFQQPKEKLYIKQWINIVKVCTSS